MTRIDFHTDVADTIGYTCRLLRKVRAAAPDLQVAVLVRDERALAALDRALWTFSDRDFLPHATANDELASQSPIILTSNADSMPNHQVLINLSSALPSPFAQFERVIEIIAKDDSDKEAGRERYAYYRQRGYPLNHYVASDA